MAAAPSAPYILVRPPASQLADGIVTFREREPLDVDLARKQWADYVQAFRDLGWGVAEVPVGEGLPDSVFIEDTVVMFGDYAVLTNPKHPTRNPEVAEVERVIDSLGIAHDQITLPGTLDGGDVLKVGHTVYVGLSGTTNQDGIAQLASFVEPRGYTVVTVPLTKALHLKSAITALPDGTIIGYEPVVDDASLFPRFLGVPEESGSHIVIAGDTLIMAADAPQTAQLLRDRGYTVRTSDISEYEKLEGCVTCLSVRVREQ